MALPNTSKCSLPSKRPPSRYLLFLASAGRYALIEGVGTAPRVGDELELADMGEARLVVSKLGRSPLPHDRRPCAYLQALQSSAESGSLVDV